MPDSTKLVASGGLAVLWSFCLVLSGCTKEDEEQDLVYKREFVDAMSSLHRELRTARGKPAGAEPSFPKIQRTREPLTREEALAIAAAIRAEVFHLLTREVVRKPDALPPPLAGFVAFGSSETWEYFSEKETPLLAYQISNAGDDLLVNPKLRFSGGPVLDSLESILSGIIQPDMDDRSKALAIWEFLVGMHLPGLPLHPGLELHEPVRFLNCYGFGFCDDWATVLARLALECGLPARLWDLDGHVVAEVFFSEKWNMLDPDGQVYFLLPNEALASVEEITPEMIRQNPSPTMDKKYYLDLFADRSGHRLMNPKRLEISPLSMHFDLRPGEEFTLNRNNRGFYFSSGFFEEPPFYGSAQLQYLPLETPDFFLQGMESVSGWVVEQSDGLARLRSQVAEGEVEFTCAFRSPYPMVGGRFTAECHLSEGSVLELLFSEDLENWKLVAEIEAGGKIDEDLYYFFRHGHGDPMRQIFLQVRLLGSNAGETVLEKLAFKVHMQAAPNSLPVLQEGVNLLDFNSDGKPGARAEILLFSTQ